MILELLRYEWDVNNQITLWGPRAGIVDYAAKQWAGVVADYHKARWELFIAELQSDSGTSFNRTTYAIDVFTLMEQPFTFSTKMYSAVTEGSFVHLLMNTVMT